MQVSGYIHAKDGTKKIVLNGKWNSFLDMQRCDEEGNPLPDSEVKRMWQVSGRDAICLVASCRIPKISALKKISASPPLTEEFQSLAPPQLVGSLSIRMIISQR